MRPHLCIAVAFLSSPQRQHCTSFVELETPSNQQQTNDNSFGTSSAHPVLQISLAHIFDYQQPVMFGRRRRGLV